MKPNFQSFVKNQSLRKSRSLQERFFEKINKTSTCWNWIGAKSSVGYGQTYFNSKVIYSHRVSYELFNGPIKNNLCVLHRCDNRICVNPKHLFLGTKKQNTQDMILKGRDKFVGEKNGMAKLTWPEIRKIRASSNERHIDLAKRFNVSRTTISIILSGRIWKEPIAI